MYQFLGECLKVKISLLIGGTKIGADLEKLREGPQVLVGSPGRVLDLIRRKQISLGYLQTFILVIIAREFSLVGVFSIIFDEEHLVFLLNIFFIVLLQ